MAKKTIYDHIEAYVNAKVNLALADYDLTTTLDGRDKKAIKLEEKVRAEHTTMCRALSKLNDQATKIRRADQGKGSTRRS